MSTLNTTSDGETFASDDPFALLRSKSLATDDGSSKRLFKTKSWSTGGSTYEETPFMSPVKKDKKGTRFGLNNPTNSFPRMSQNVHGKRRPYTLAKYDRKSMSPSTQEYRALKSVNSGSKASIQVSTSSDNLISIVDRQAENENSKFSCGVEETRDAIDEKAREYATLVAREGSKIVEGALFALQSSLAFCADRADYVCPAMVSVKTKANINDTLTPEEEFSKSSIVSEEQPYLNGVETNEQSQAMTLDGKRTEKESSREPRMTQEMLRDSVEQSMRRFEASIYSCSGKTNEHSFKGKLGLQEMDETPGAQNKNDAEGLAPLRYGRGSARASNKATLETKEITIQRFSILQKKSRDELVERDPPVIDGSRSLGLDSIRQSASSMRFAAIQRSKRTSAPVGQPGLRFGKGEIESLPRRRETLREAMQKLSEDHNSGRKDSARIRQLKVESKVKGTPETPIDLTMMEEKVV